MDFGNLNLILIDARLDFNALHRIFLIFTVLNSRFNKNNAKTSKQEVKNKKVLEREVKSKQEVHHRLSTFLVWEVLLTAIRTRRQKLPVAEETSSRVRNFQ